jgi:hypothetical protein
MENEIDLYYRERSLLEIIEWATKQIESGNDYAEIDLVWGYYNDISHMMLKAFKK